MRPTVADNIVSGFRKCGIVPLNADMVLSRVRKFAPAEEREEIKRSVSQVVLSRLDDISRSCATPMRAQKKRRLAVKPGRSVSLMDLETTSDDKDEEKENDRGSDDNYSDDDRITDGAEDINSDDITDDYAGDNLALHDFVAVVYDTWYVGQIREITPVSLTVSFMEHTTAQQNRFRWPDKPDRQIVERKDILTRLETEPFVSASSSSTRAFFQLQLSDFNNITRLYDNLFN